MIKTLSSLRIIIISLVLLFPAYFLSELILSFLPYSLLGHFLLSLFLIILLLRSFKKKQKTDLYVLLLLVGSFNLFLLQGKQFLNTYYSTPSYTYESTSNTSFLYANIYYKNNNFSGLLSTIQKHDPDIILFVEYAKIHDKTLKEKLLEKYPYRSRYIGGRHFDGDVVYSRFPLQKISHRIRRGEWAFTHITIQTPGQDTDFVLVHTSAPISPDFLAMRTRQLTRLQETLTTHYKDTNQEKAIIVLGDFNISPRSDYYTALSESMNSLNIYNSSLDLQNTQYNTIFPYTRCRAETTFACSHIDHIWSNTQTNLQRIDIPGSDHDGFFGKI